MPTLLEFRTEGVFIWNYGVLTGREILASNRAIYDYQFEGDFIYQIAMNGQLEEFAAEPEDMRKLAEMDRAYVGHAAQIGIVVAESDYLFGMCRMWNQQAETDSFHATVVRHVRDAQSLLKARGIEVGSFEYPPLPPKADNKTVFYDHAIRENAV
ncbi:MAG: hypothetical protein AAF387_19980 [Pseudomonadota bacterium]